MYRRAFPDAHVTFDELITSGDRIVGRWSATGTHKGELPGMAPTGRKIAISGITIYRIPNDQITEAGNSWICSECGSNSVSSRGPCMNEACRP